MYTFYFQALEDLDQWKLIAYRGPENFDIIELGETYDNLDLSDLLDMGCRVVQYPLFDYDYGLPVQTTRMFYAKGYRGPDKQLTDPEYLKFVNYGNGQEQILPDWCSEDFRHGGHGKEPIPDKSAKSDEVADYAKNDQCVYPGIGPLPPQASLAPLIESGYRNGTWTFNTHASFEPWTPEHGIVQTKEPPIPPEGSMLLPKFKTNYVDVPEFAIDSSNWQDRRIEQFIKDAETTKSLTAPDELSWWQKLKNWCKTDF